MATIKCRKCDRALRSARYQEAGADNIGPVCARRERLVAAAYKPEQVAKAEELIADRGIVRARPKSPVFVAVTSRGDAIYYVGPRGCTCPHGRRAAAKGEAAHCYHAAARTLKAA